MCPTWRACWWGLTTVVSCRLRVRLDPEVKKGDTVLYGKYSGTEVTVGNKEYLILREADILAVL